MKMDVVIYNLMTMIRGKQQMYKLKTNEGIQGKRNYLFCRR